MKHVALISFILLLASGNYMQQQFPIDRPESESTSKIVLDQSSLKSYYTDTLYHKPIGSIGEDVKNYKKHLQNYYYADFLFLIAYSILFYLIARSLHRESVGRLTKKIGYTIMVGLIILLFLSDAGENILMLIYIDSDFTKYTPWIAYLNGLKTLLFIVVVYYLIINHIKYVVQKFYSILQK